MSEANQQGASIASKDAELQQTLSRQIVLGTWGRIHDLHVEVTGDQVRIRGRTPSHYIKQLVLHSVYEVIGTDSTVRIDFEIQVGKTARQVLPGNNDLWGVPQD